MHNPFSVGDEFVPAITAPADWEGPAWWFALRGNDLLVMQHDSQPQIPRARELNELGLKPVRIQYLGTLSGRACFSAELPEDAETPDGAVFSGLRELYGVLDENLFGIAGRAFQIVDWDRTTQFCGRCGIPNETLTEERAKRCPRCGLHVYPRLSPAVIMRIERGDEILLAHSGRFRNGMFSVVAGFVEAGESLEEAVAREVQEEVGLRIKDIRYFGSQPWPFPNSLMLAFVAQYASGEIHVDGTEILEAGWFTADALPPTIPAPISIARRLIDDFISSRGAKPR